MALNENVSKAAGYVGLASSALSLVLGIVHVCRLKARIYWPDHGLSIIDDVQFATWRARLFTFEPNIFFDVWTPFFFGIIGLLGHMTDSKLTKKITQDYLHYFLFLTVQGLFANLGYDGGLGILVSIVTFVAASLALACFFMDKKAEADLHLPIANKLGLPQKQ